MATVDDDRPYGEPAPIHEAHHDADDSLSVTIIDALASVEGVDPTDTDLRLYDEIDLEALDALFRRDSGAGHWRFEFSVLEYRVIVDADGHISIFERE